MTSINYYKNRSKSNSKKYLLTGIFEVLMKINLLVFTVFMFSFSKNWASDDSGFVQKARTRQYVGGPDESDLKVQTQVMKLQKSKNETSLEDSEEGF